MKFIATKKNLLISFTILLSIISLFTSRSHSHSKFNYDEELIFQTPSFSITKRGANHPINGLLSSNIKVFPKSMYFVTSSEHQYGFVFETIGETNKYPLLPYLKHLSGSRYVMPWRYITSCRKNEDRIEIEFAGDDLSHNKLTLVNKKQAVNLDKERILIDHFVTQSMFVRNSVREERDKILKNSETIDNDSLSIPAFETNKVKNLIAAKENEIKKLTHKFEAKKKALAQKRLSVMKPFILNKIYELKKDRIEEGINNVEAEIKNIEDVNHKLKYETVVIKFDMKRKYEKDSNKRTKPLMLLKKYIRLNLYQNVVNGKDNLDKLNDALKKINPYMN